MSRVVAVFVVCLLLAGCGDNEPAAKKPAPTPDPVAQLRAAAEKVVSTQDGYAVCYELATERFIQAVFKDKNQCTNLRKVLGPGTPKAVDTTIVGTTADAVIQYEGSPVEGPFGTLSFVREGNAWKLDKVDDVFMHSAFKASMHVFSNGALAVPEVQDCMAARADKMSDGAVRSWREQGKSEKFLSCAQRELQGLIMLTGTAKYALKGGAEDAGGFSSAIFAGLMSGVQKHCRK